MHSVPRRVTTAVRCFTLPRAARRSLRKSAPRGWRSLPLGARVLVFDTETTNDRFQNLLVGAFQIYAMQVGAYRVIHAGLILGDILTPLQISGVEAYARDYDLRVYTRGEFVARVFLPEVYDLGALCVGFNLPFDLSRLAVKWAAGRRQWRDGFTLYLTESKWDPAIRVKSLDNKRAFIEFASYRGYRRREAAGHWIFPGRFLDLRTLAFALTGKGHSLESACMTFGVTHGKQLAKQHGVLNARYIDYNRRDVLATWELYLKLVEEWHRHPFAPVPTPFAVEHDPEALVITRAYSPASLAKAYLRTMGTRPRLTCQPQFPKKILGYAMTAYFGGRSECHIRRQIVPVTLLDVLSMYPTVCVLMGLWRFVIADHVEPVEDTAQVVAFLERVTEEDLYDPETWPQLVALVEVYLDGDILPIRAQFQEGADYQIGLPEITANGNRPTRWYMLPDLLASKLLTGKVPHIRRAFRFRAVGMQPGLRPVKLFGEAEVDPRYQDFFRVLIEKRHEFQEAKRQAESAGHGVKPAYFDSLQHGLKILANAIYGILAEVDEKNTGTIEATVHGLHRFTAKVSKSEHFGQYAFPILASLITSGARLILAMLETELRRVDATYLFCDTDSIAIAGPPKIVEAIRRKFAALTPYAFGGDLLKLEPENIPDPRCGKDKQLYGYSISAKRYVLFNIAADGQIIIHKFSEHGLGHLMAPVSNQDGQQWMEEMWRGIIRWASREIKELGAGLAFADLPALGRFPITKPSILKRFEHLNTVIDPKTKKRVARPHSQQIKPFNFMLVAFPDTGDITKGGEAYWDIDDDLLSSGSTRQPIRPIAPYEANPGKWRRLRWVDLHTERPVRLYLGRKTAGLATGLIPVQTYRDGLARYVTHPEAKAAGADGLPCGPYTAGELSRLKVKIDSAVHIGKESHELEDVQAGLVTPQSSYVHYVDAKTEWRIVLERLRRIPVDVLVKRLGISRSQVYRILKGECRPRDQGILTNILSEPGDSD